MNTELNPFPNERKFVYGVITNKAVYEGMYYFTFDLVNDEMIDFDSKKIFTENNLLRDNPKEYLYFYFMTIVDNLQYHLKMKELIEGDECLVELMPDIYNEKFLYDGYMRAKVYFTASPINIKNYLVRITRENTGLNNHKVNYNKYNNVNIIQKTIDKVFTNKLNIEQYRVHNVGQANCTSIIFKNKNKLFYDIGISRYRNADKQYRNYSVTFKNFKFKDYKAVILSHWHLDHYLGVVLDNSGDILKKLWIVPEIKYGYNAKRLANIVNFFSNLVVVSDTIKKPFYNKDDITLCKGNGSKINDRGIILCTKNSKKKLVSLGDSSYKCIMCSNCSSNIHIDYLIVPHHGGDVEGNIPFVSNNSSAIISVGFYNTYNHPNPNVINYLNNKGFTIKRTDQDKKQIIKF